jgi:tripartite motif-containing protein 56
MATFESSNIREKLNNITECSICADTYDDPRVLPCIHTYCLKCIKHFCQNKKPGARVSCPLCRKDFVVPERGIDSLPKNFFVEQLKDLTQTSSIHCQGCGDTSGERQATMYCVECQQKFCETCVSLHRGMRLARSHTLLNIGDDGKVPETVGKMLALHCDKHLDKALELYCFQCNEVMCMVCFATSHQSHKCSEVDKVSEDFRSQLTCDIQNMSKKAKYCRDMIKEHETKRYEFSNVVRELRGR